MVRQDCDPYFVRNRVELGGAYFIQLYDRPYDNTPRYRLLNHFFPSTVKAHGHALDLSHHCVTHQPAARGREIPTGARPALSGHVIETPLLKIPGSMSLRRRDWAIAAVVIFVSWGFVTHWLPLLRFIGYAFSAGYVTALFVVAACLLFSVRSTLSHCSTRHRLRSVAFVDSRRWAADVAWIRENARYHRKVILPSSPFVVAESLDELLDWILRDFVASWYGNISSSPAFINEIDNAIRDSMVHVLGKLASLDIAETAVLRFVPIFTRHLKDFYEAEQHVRGKRLNRNVTESEELDLAIAAKYREGNLHPAASLAFSDTKLVQTEHLRKVVADLLPKIVSKDIIESRATAVLVKELLACAVLGPIMQLLSDPDTWNQILEAFGKSMLQDRKTVRKLRAALDTHASPAPKENRPRAFPKLSPNDDERKFEKFVRAIRQCSTLSDARRFRNEVSSQLKRESMLQDQDQIYLRRLETGKRILDQRVGMLSVAGGSNKVQSTQTAGENQTVSRMENAGVLEILRDASGLSYFMEYMDRLHLMSLVQFWIVVDGLRNPLEDDSPGDSSFVDVPMQWSESDRLDLTQISEAYLTRPELRISSAIRQAVQDFLRSGKHATMNQYQKARSAILRAQTSVQEELQEKHLPNFRKSDLFYKLLTSDVASAKVEAQTLAAHESHGQAYEPPGQNFRLRPQPPSVPITRVNSGVSNGKLAVKSTSSSDLKSVLLGNQDAPTRIRRSLDVNTSGPLFDDYAEQEDRERPRRSFDAVSANSEQPATSQQHVVEAMEAALNDIMTDNSHHDELPDSLADPQNQALENSEKLLKPTREFGAIEAVSLQEKSERPNLASLGLVDTSSRIGFFRDNDLFGEDKLLEDEHTVSDDGSEGKDLDEEIHEAAPGDLGLAEAISALTVDVDRLIAQESVVDTLTRKAELTNNVAELRILGKSKSSLQREIQRKELQRQQYIVQESDNSLFGRAVINIKSIMVGKEDDGQEFALYVIEVSRQAGEHMSPAAWAVARRYSEFHRLHQRLRQLYPAVRNLDFPRRRLVMKLQNEFLHRRRVSLQHYLQELLRLPAVCRSRDLRAFLSQRPILSKDDIKGNGERADIVSRIYNSVSDGMDEFLGNIPVLDQLSIAGQNLISAATSQYYTPGQTMDGIGSTDSDGVGAQEARTELEAFDNQTLEPIVKPICDLFLEIFELNRSSNWLRGRAVVVVLHQLLGGTVERKVREVVHAVLAEDNLLKYLALVKDSMWPGGVLQKERKQRTEAEKRASRREAGVVLAALIPELAGSVVGRANAQAASRRLFATINNPRLNLHIVFRVLDEVVAVVYP